MAHWDTIIAGQGLAGTTLAWHLREMGQRVLLVDPAEKVTSSKIAAGLMTPITGQRIALSWRVAEFLPKATKFYQSIEALTGTSFFHQRRAVRLFSKEDEIQRWAKRQQEQEFQQFLSLPQPAPLVDSSRFASSGEGFEMNAAQLDVANYLAASRRVFDAEGMVETAELDWTTDVQLSNDTASWRNHTASKIISCEGFAASKNPHFQWIRYKAAKGEILTVKFEQPLPPRCIHRGLWMAPTLDPCIWRIGSTYEWSELNQTPTGAGRENIESRLRDLVTIRWQVIDHSAAVRPIIHESKAMLGLHPAKPSLGYFNGLGSKGSLHAPWYAAMLASHLVSGTELEALADLQTNT